MRVEISEEVMEAVRRLAEAQGRSEGEVLEEAVARYLKEADPSFKPDLGRPIRRGRKRYPEPSGGGQNGGFLTLIDRMSSRFELDEDEAMRIAVEEQHAFRRERAAREEAER